MSGTNSNQITGAVFLIGLGIVALLGFWWPGMMFVVGIALLVGEYVDTKTLSFSSGRVIAAAAVIVVGLLGLIDFNINWGAIWPVVLILVGLGLLARNAMGADKPKRE